MRGGFGSVAVGLVTAACLLGCSGRDEAGRKDPDGADASVDAGGPVDAGPRDGRASSDAGPEDAGSRFDAAPPDAGAVDAADTDGPAAAPCSPPAFEAPTDGLTINAEGTGGHTADLEPGTTACDLLARVRCDCVGAPVFVRDGAGITVGSADCTAAEDATTTHAGIASALSLALPAGAVRSFDLRAIQTVGSRELASDPVHVGADCRPPSPRIVRPPCLSIVWATAGTTVDFTWSSDEYGSYTLEIFEGSTLVYAGGASGTGGAFPVSLPEGTYDVALSGSDRFGNVGYAGPCTMAVEPPPP